MKKILISFVASFLLLVGKAQNCPGISVVPYTDELIASDTAIFTVVTTSLKVNVTYNWKVNTGVIVSGQGTARILVATEKAEGAFVTATVEVGGLPVGCGTVASASAELIDGAQLVVSGRFTNGQELKKAVQQFIASSNFKDPDNTATAFIYLYKSAVTTEEAMKIFKDAIIGAFEFNKIKPAQYKIVEGKAKKFATYEIYLLQRGAKEPKPTE
jgi:hypothetical protein